MTDQQTTLADYDRIQGEDGHGVAVPEHTDETRRLAAESLLTAMEGIEDAEATEQLAALSRKEVLRQHTGDPDEIGCGCAEEGWWCPEGDGERGLFWWFGSADLAKVTDAAHKRGVE
jgi:hypothetical protein